MSRKLRVKAAILAAWLTGSSAVTVVDRVRDSLTYEGKPSGHSATVSVGANTAAKGTSDSTGAQQRQLMRSERKHVDEPQQSADDLTMRLMDQRREAQEQEAATVFEQVLAGKELEMTEFKESEIPGVFLNMAGMSVSQSSTDKVPASAGGDGVATRAIDGNTNPLYSAGSCTHTKYEWKPWWEVELGAAYHISSVKVTNRGDRCGEQINLCSTVNMKVDLSICHADVQFPWSDPDRWATGQGSGKTLEVGCPMVGNSVRIDMVHEDYLYLCEVTVKAVTQSLLEKASRQCYAHNWLVQPMAPPNAKGLPHEVKEGLCLAGEPSLSNTTNVPPGFNELLVGRASSGSVLQTTADECEEHLLKSEELVEGATWRANAKGNETIPMGNLTKGSSVLGECRLLTGRRVTGATPAANTRCFRKLRCPHDMKKWRKLAGIGLHHGQRWG